MFDGMMNGMCGGGMMGCGLIVILWVLLLLLVIAVVVIGIGWLVRLGRGGGPHRRDGQDR
jgi:hypothetical protein